MELKRADLQLKRQRKVYKCFTRLCYSLCNHSNNFYLFFCIAFYFQFNQLCLEAIAVGAMFNLMVHVMYIQ